MILHLTKTDSTGPMNLDLVSSFQAILSENNPFASAISKTVGAAGDMMRNIAGNIQKGDSNVHLYNVYKLFALVNPLHSRDNFQI